jgi:hypothetical protein
LTHFLDSPQKLVVPEVNDQVSVLTGQKACGPIVYTAGLNGIDSIVTFNQKSREL